MAAIAYHLPYQVSELLLLPPCWASIGGGRKDQRGRAGQGRGRGDGGGGPVLRTGIMAVVEAQSSKAAARNESSRTIGNVSRRTFVAPPNVAEPCTCTPALEAVSGGQPHPSPSRRPRPLALCRRVTTQLVMTLSGELRCRTHGAGVGAVPLCTGGRGWVEVVAV